MKRLVFVSFQDIINGTPLGMVKYLIPVIQNIQDSSKINASYLIGNINGYEGTLDINRVSWVYVIIVKTFKRFNNLLKNVVPNYKIRFWQEKLFDLFITTKIKEAVVLVSSAYLSKAQIKNKSLGGINIFIAGNPDDYEIHDLLKNEMISHGVEFKDAYTYEKRIAFVSKSILLYDHIVTSTISEFDSYKKRIAFEKISYVESHIIPNLNSFPKIQKDKNKKLTFCFVAHPFWLKGLPYLLEAWSMLNTDRAELHIAGRIDSDLQKIIDKKFSTLKNVKYLGWVDDLNEFLRRSHVCVIPSLLDAGPATVAEAMYCGVPTIVSYGCGARTLVKEGVNGFVVHAANSDALSKKINWFINNKEKIELMGTEASITISELAKSNQNTILTEHILSIIKKLQVN